MLLIFNVEDIIQLLE